MTLFLVPFPPKQVLLGLEKLSFPVFGKISHESLGKQRFSESPKQPLSESGCPAARRSHPALLRFSGGLLIWGYQSPIEGSCCQRTDSANEFVPRTTTLRKHLRLLCQRLGRQEPPCQGEGHEIHSAVRKCADWSTRKIPE